jgi:hypothetical protein
MSIWNLTGKYCQHAASPYLVRQLSVCWTRGTLNRLVNFMLCVPARMD